MLLKPLHRILRSILAEGRQKELRIADNIIDEVADFFVVGEIASSFARNIKLTPDFGVPLYEGNIVVVIRRVDRCIHAGWAGANDDRFHYAGILPCKGPKNT